eukprot:m.996489 g.996489  ORF g.996489 m.996489 type:complete len:74 (+) comp24019_c0_seq42:3946-4167(+)
MAFRSMCRRTRRGLVGRDVSTTGQNTRVYSIGNMIQTHARTLHRKLQQSTIHTSQPQCQAQPHPLIATSTGQQ